MLTEWLSKKEESHEKGVYVHDGIRFTAKHLGRGRVKIATLHALVSYKGDIYISDGVKVSKYVERHVELDRMLEGVVREGKKVIERAKKGLAHKEAR